MSLRFFVSGLVLMLLFSLGHLGGFLAAARSARRDPALVELTKAMRAHRQRLLGFEPSILDFREYFSLNFSILLLLAAALGFGALSVSHAGATAVVIRTFSILYISGMILLLATSLYFSVVQGIVSCTLIGVLFGVAWWLA